MYIKILTLLLLLSLLPSHKMPDDYLHNILYNMRIFRNLIKKLILMTMFYAIYIVIECYVDKKYSEFNLREFIVLNLYKIAFYLVVLIFRRTYFTYKIILSFISILVLILAAFELTKILCMCVYYKKITGINIYDYSFQVFILMTFDAYKILEL